MRLPGRKIGFALLLSALTLAGAAPNAGAAKTKPPTVKWLLGKQFKSVSATGSPLIQGQTVEIRFFMHSNYPASKPKRPTISVYAGCNYWGTKFRVRKKRLITYGMTDSTAMGCEVNPDRWLSRVMRKGLVIRRKGKRLVLTRPAEGVKLVFKLKRVVEEEPVPDEEPVPGGDPVTTEDLLGKSFESVKVTGQQVDKPIELRFSTGRLARLDDELKQVDGPLLSAYLGCNWLDGEYQVEDGRLYWLDTWRTPFWCQYDMDGWFHSLLYKSKFNSLQGEVGLEATIQGDLLELTSPKSQIRGRIQIVLKQVPSKN